LPDCGFGASLSTAAPPTASLLIRLSLTNGSRLYPVINNPLPLGGDELLINRLNPIGRHIENRCRAIHLAEGLLEIRPAALRTATEFGHRSSSGAAIKRTLRHVNSFPIRTLPLNRLGFGNGRGCLGEQNRYLASVNDAQRSDACPDLLLTPLDCVLCGYEGSRRLHIVR
jgi:hypothetical protein